MTKVNERAEIQERWAKEGFSCDLWVDTPGQKWEDFSHDTDEMICVMEGSIELEINSKRQVLKPREEAFIPARANHSVRNIGGTTAKWLYGYRSK